MIASISGSVEQAGLEGSLTLRVGAVAIVCSMPVVDSAGLQPGEHVLLHTSLQLSAPQAGAGGGGIRLYGFATAEGRDLFELLLGASGVGPRVALALLELSPGGLARALAEGDEKTLTAAKGVGPRLAKKLILELGEKAGLQFAALLRRAPGQAESGSPAAQVETDAIEAVVALGFTRLQAEQALAAARADYQGSDAAQLVRMLLARLR
jgi:Holliday junction DNA helicase RuvA